MMKHVVCLFIMCDRLCIWQVSPRHRPMLMSPCGHTLCEHCSHRQSYCPVCHCLIESLLTNVALQRVVNHHHHHHRDDHQQSQIDGELTADTTAH